MQANYGQEGIMERAVYSSFKRIFCFVFKGEDFKGIGRGVDLKVKCRA